VNGAAADVDNDQEEDDDLSGEEEEEGDEDDEGGLLSLLWIRICFSADPDSTF
jgi:hypothetical protein